MEKLIRITTIPLSLEKLLEGQLSFMSQFYEVTAISAEKKRLERYGRDNNVKTYCIEMTRAITPFEDIKAVIKLYKYLKAEKPLIVHTHTPKAGIVGMMAAKMAGVPLRLHTVAGLPLIETTGTKRIILNQVEKLTYRMATKIYPNSQGLKNIILEEGFAPEKKLKVLGKGSSNGIDISYFDPTMYSEANKKEINRELNIPEQDVVFIFIGRLVSEKGINELISAFTNLHKSNPQISLLLVGPYEEDLDPLAENTVVGIKKHSKIFTTGYQQDVRPYLAIADILTFPSYREGFPNVVMQAGAMGLPSIVSNINGCNEIITEGKNGMIIPVKNETALFNAMDVLISDGQLRKSLAINARDEITRNYGRKEFWEILKSEYDFLQKEAGDPKED